MPGRIQIPIARVFVDEAQYHRSEQNTYLRFLRSLDCPIWYVSGTPFERGMSDLQFWFKAMEWRGWYHSSEASPFVHKNFVELTKTARSVKEHLTSRAEKRSNNEKVEKLTTAMRSKRDKVEKTFSELLAKTMIRRTDETLLFGQKCIDVPPHDSKDVGVFFDVNDPLDSASLDHIEMMMSSTIAELNQSIGEHQTDNTIKNKLYSSLLHSSLPGLRFIQGCGRHRGEDIKGLYKNIDMNTNPYMNGLDDLIASSPKMRSIQNLVSRLSQEKNEDGSSVKGIMVADRPAVAYVAHLMLQKMGIKSAFLPATMRSIDRHKVVELFKRGDVEDVEEDDTLSNDRTIVCRRSLHSGSFPHSK